MSIEIRVPELGESISDALLVRWLKDDGATVRVDEPLLELETEKSAMEVVAPAAGRLRIREREGSRVRVGAVLGEVAEEAAREPAAAPEPSRSPAGSVAETPRPRPAPAGDGRRPERVATIEPERAPAPPREAPRAPAPREVTAGRREDDVERVPMSELRRTIAARLVEAQRTAAILTTFNEADVSELQALRARHRARFRERHGVDLGLVSLFARATILALREAAVLNASIEDGDVVYHRRVHLGVAVSTPRGLVVPVVRDADGLDIAGLERRIGELAGRAREAKLGPDELRGGTFTITNGGVFGSVLSTPILNPPQSGILGMHAIQDRPVARDGQVVIRPMMWLALSYDHRLVDGAQAVRFLVRLKEHVEDPVGMVLDA
jgi:2-oxoglutarate dehydrogenase E2 component (dihydrolipoamide succinyltransferase)